MQITDVFTFLKYLSLKFLPLIMDHPSDLRFLNSNLGLSIFSILRGHMRSHHLFSRKPQTSRSDIFYSITNNSFLLR